MLSRPTSAAGRLVAALDTPDLTRAEAWASALAPQAISSASTSEKLCPASATSAIEPERKPKVASTATNPELSAMPMPKARPCPPPAGAWWW